MNESEKAIIKLAINILDAQLRTKGDAMTSPEAVRSYLRLQMETEENEVFAVMYLDTQHRLLEFVKMFQGTIDGATVYPRVVAQTGLRLSAACVVVVHNHPSGNPAPSNADRQLTVRLKEALALVDIRLLDHVVIGHASFTSFAESGLI